MDVRSDEAQVRQLFDQMTASQPEAPPDRHSRIRRRARRHRLAQAAGTLAVLAAAAAVAAGVGVSASRIPPASGQRPCPAGRCRGRITGTAASRSAYSTVP